MKKIDQARMGLNVMRNVRRFRGETTYAELSRKLAEYGRPIPPLGLRHLEAGQRRVDVDDLFALAFALDISPTMLLTGHPDQPDFDLEALYTLMGGAMGLAKAPTDGND